MPLAARAAYPRLRHQSLIVVAIVVLGLGALVPFLDREGLTILVFDDAFYYYQIARNVAGGLGFSFDGIHPTNGFQPLWQFLLVPLFALVTDAVLAMRVVLLLQVGLIAASAVLVQRALARTIHPFAAVAAALALVAQPGAAPILRSGMESALSLFTLCLAWHAMNRLRRAAPTGVDHRHDPSARTTAAGLLLGLAGAAAFLARLEALAAIPLAILFARRKLRDDWRAGAALLAASGTVVVAYFAWNRLAFDLWLPVSGMVKLAPGSHLTIAERLLPLVDIPWLGRNLVCTAFGQPTVLSLPASGILAYSAVLALLAGAIWIWRVPMAETIRATGADYPLALCGAIVLIDKLTLVNLPPWYQAPILLITSILYGLWLDAVGRRLLPPTALLANLAAVVVVGLVALSQVYVDARLTSLPELHYARYRLWAADWVREHVTADERVGCWNAGTVGYFSGRHVINLDGFVNDAAYMRLLLSSDSIDSYLEREGIVWLTDSACSVDPRPVLLERRRPDAHLVPRFELVDSSRNDAIGGCFGFAVWRVAK